MKNIYMKQTVNCISKQKGGGFATDGANGACPHCSDYLNRDPFDNDYGEAGPPVGVHSDGQDYAWSAPGSTNRHGLV